MTRACARLASDAGAVVEPAGAADAALVEDEEGVTAVGTVLFADEEGVTAVGTVLFADEEGVTAVGTVLFADEERAGAVGPEPCEDVPLQPTSPRMLQLAMTAGTASVRNGDMTA
jgi:hypothetical protein